MTVLAFVMSVAFAVALAMVALFASRRRGGWPKGTAGGDYADGGIAYSDSGSGADCGSGSDGGGGCDGGGGGD